MPFIAGNEFYFELPDFKGLPVNPFPANIPIDQSQTSGVIYTRQPKTESPYYTILTDVFRDSFEEEKAAFERAGDEFDFMITLLDREEAARDQQELDIAAADAAAQASSCPC